MTLALSAACKLARVTAVRTTVDIGTGAGVINLYSGTRPAAGVAATAGTLCAVITLSDPSGTVDAAGYHMTAPAPAQATVAGIITWARVLDSNAAWVMDADVRQADAGDVAIADFIIDVAQVYVGSFVNLVSAVLAEA